jgi:hypothetical protein
VTVPGGDHVAYSLYFGAFVGETPAYTMAVGPSAQGGGGQRPERPERAARED